MFRRKNHARNPRCSAIVDRTEALRSEILQDRCLLTAYIVDATNDDPSGQPDGTISLREAVIASNTNVAFGDAPAGSLSGDVIRFDPSLANATITLINGQLDITDDVKIQAGTLGITIDANNASRLLNISADENVVIGGLTLIRGTAPNGGGVVVSGGGRTTLFRVTLRQNTSNGNGGGAIYNNGENLYLTECLLDGNQAIGTSGRGGGVYLLNGLVAVRGGQFRANTAVASGGGLELVNGNVFMTNALIGGSGISDGNRAGASSPATVGDGGGIHISGTTAARLAIRGGAVIGNSAAHQGGGLWNQINGVMMIRNGALIQGNIARGNAASDGGGGIFNNATLRLVDSTLASNSALGTSGGGGGIYSASGQVSVINSTIRSNLAYRAGGGIEIVNGDLVVRSSVIGGSIAEANIAGPTGSANPGHGGGIHVAGTNDTRVLVLGGTISQNHAQTQGGGIWVNQGSRVILREGAEVTANRVLASGSVGGGIYVRGHLQADGATISSNVSVRGGGGAYIATGGSANFLSATLSANDGGQFGGGVYNEGFVNFNTSLVSNNTVTINGGGIFEELRATTNLISTNVVNNSPNNVNP